MNNKPASKNTTNQNKTEFVPYSEKSKVFAEFAKKSNCKIKGEING